MSSKISFIGRNDRRFKFFRDTKLEVGVFDNTPHPDSTNNKTVVEIATIHEFGAGDIPERPFLRLGLVTAKADILKASRDSARSGDLTIMGDAMVDAVKDMIAFGPLAPLAESTIKKKGHDDILVDSEVLYDSIEWRKV